MLPTIRTCPSNVATDGHVWIRPITKEANIAGFMAIYFFWSVLVVGLIHSGKSFVHGLITSMQSTTILLCLRPFFQSEEQTLEHPNNWASLLLTSLMQKKVLGADAFTSYKIGILKLPLWDGKTFSHQIFLTELIYIFVCNTIHSTCVARLACLENKTCKH